MGEFFSYVWAATVATFLTVYGVLYVFEIAASRGQRAGIFAGLGLALGLFLLGSMPIVQTGIQALKLTQYYQYVRFVVIALALVIALFIYLDFRRESLRSAASGWTYFRVFLLGFLMHTITPLPLEFFNQMISNGGLLKSAGALVGGLLNFDNPFANPLPTLTLPIVAFLIYWLTAFLGSRLRDNLLMSDGLRLGLLGLGLLVFIGTALYVGFNGLTYEPSLFNKVTNFGINRLTQ